MNTMFHINPQTYSKKTITLLGIRCVIFSCCAIYCISLSVISFAQEVMRKVLDNRSVVSISNSELTICDDVLRNNSTGKITHFVNPKTFPINKETIFRDSDGSHLNFLSSSGEINEVPLKAFFEEGTRVSIQILYFNGREIVKAIERTESGTSTLSNLSKEQWNNFWSSDINYTNKNSNKDGKAKNETSFLERYRRLTTEMEKEETNNKAVANEEESMTLTDKGSKDLDLEENHLVLTEEERRLNAENMAWIEKTKAMLEELNQAWTGNSTTTSQSSTETPSTQKNYFIINFPINSSKIEIDTLNVLTKIVEELNKQKGLIAIIVGHSNDFDNNDYNLKVSINRAFSTKDHLVKQGISEERIFVYGKGNSESFKAGKTEDGRRLNRRVEIFLL